jgi:hypothetical protein
VVLGVVLALPDTDDDQRHNVARVVLVALVDLYACLVVV